MGKSRKVYHEYDEETEKRIAVEGYDWFRAGVVITDEREKKFLVVQEAHEHIQGLWNIPLGHVKKEESIADAAVREALEESGYTCKLTGICHIGQRRDVGNPYTAVVFTAEKGVICRKVDPNDIMAVDWKSIEEISHLARKGLLRNEELMLSAIHNVRDGIVGNIDLFSVYSYR